LSSHRRRKENSAETTRSFASEQLISVTAFEPEKKVAVGRGEMSASRRHTVRQPRYRSHARQLTRRCEWSDTGSDSRTPRRNRSGESWHEVLTTCSLESRETIQCACQSSGSL